MLTTTLIPPSAPKKKAGIGFTFVADFNLPRCDEMGRNLRSGADFFLLSLSLFLLSLIPTAHSLGFRAPRLGTSAYLTSEEQWLDQTLDHFSPFDHRQFKQRYYEFLDYYRVSDGPIFLKLCGESSCDGIANDYTAVLAKKFGAALVSPEHRYYGRSSPFEYLTTENLRFLSSKQALFDLAVFRQHYQDYLNTKYNISSASSSWFVFGVSYSGALSAWFRLKFPHLTCGSLASSGVVLAVYNFTEFDQQIGESAGAECKAVLQEITKLVEEQLQSDGSFVKSLFSASMMLLLQRYPLSTQSSITSEIYFSGNNFSDFSFSMGTRMFYAPLLLMPRKMVKTWWKHMLTLLKITTLIVLVLRFYHTIRTI